MEDKVVITTEEQIPAPLNSAPLQETAPVSNLSAKDQESVRRRLVEQGEDPNKASGLQNLSESPLRRISDGESLNS